MDLMTQGPPPSMSGPGVEAGHLDVTHPCSYSHTPDTHTDTLTDPHVHTLTHMHTTHLVLNLWCTNTRPHSLS